MYFFKKNGRQYVDCTGDLILTHNDAVIKARSKSAGPHKALNARYVIVPRLGFSHKIRASWQLLGFIWGPVKPLTMEEE